MLETALAPAKTDPVSALPVWCVTSTGKLPAEASAWAKASAFKATSGNVLLVPAADGKLAGAVLGVGNGEDPFVTGALVKALPAGNWHLADTAGLDAALAATGFLLGAYRYDKYRKPSSEGPRLVLDPSVDRAPIERAVKATWLARDLVNTPANDMGPDRIEEAARTVAKQHKATIKVVTGDDLLAKNFPMIHAVGRAATIAPRLIDIQWGNRKAPRLTLVGKGVAFDSGGLDIKPASGMRNMKKDMGGAANILALATMIMDAKLPVRLRVLIPAVENAIAGNAFRPGDILKSRNGMTVEIGNTDAEGRLVLADALSLADEETPDLVIDMATLTGAARVALGPELPPFYTDDEALAAALAGAAAAHFDPLWRMPLWQPYAKGLSSTVADIGNVTTDGMAGSVTAALFLQKFVTKAKSWVHLDIFAWTPSARPHAPVGGEAQGIRALFSVLQERFR